MRRIRRAGADVIRAGRVEPAVAHTALDELVRNGYRRLPERKRGD